MLHSALTSTRKLLLAGAALAFLSLPCFAQPDPPAEAGRLSYINGNVSFQPVGSDDFGQAFPNLPLGPGDRIVTDYDGQAEIQVGQTFVRIGASTDVTLVDSTPTGLIFGVAQGSIHVQSFGLWEGQSVYVNTPSGSSTLSAPGQFRVDVIPDASATVFSSFGSNLLITGAGDFYQPISATQALELVGSNPVTPQWLQAASWDALDTWSHYRDEQIAQGAANQYVSPEIPGAYELSAAGTWQPGTPYGAVWFPNNVPGGWAPYHYGHWVNRAPWGWVWVEDESWGYAPFHYGRWVTLNGPWGWIPGPPAAHPVWSPALVVFAGGQPGVSVWFPLGPGEPYRPWYPCSPRYIDTVNISNITVTNVVHVQTTYVNINVTNVTYVNRTIGVTAVSNADFASGKPAANAAVAVNVHLMDHVQPLAALEPRPTAQSFIGHPPARPVQVAAARPVLINAKGMAVAARPGAHPMAAPVKPVPAVKALPGHAVVAPPPTARPQPSARTAPAPAGKPTPIPAVAARSMAKPASPPEAKAPAEPNAKPAAPAVTKPGTTPPGKTDKEKKNDKDKDKDEEKPKENPNGE